MIDLAQFSALTHLMSSVVLGKYKSVNAGYKILRVTLKKPGIVFVASTNVSEDVDALTQLHFKDTGLLMRYTDPSRRVLRVYSRHVEESFELPAPKSTVGFFLIASASDEAIHAN